VPRDVALVEPDRGDVDELSDGDRERRGGTMPSPPSATMSFPPGSVTGEVAMVVEAAEQPARRGMV